MTVYWVISLPKTLYTPCICMYGSGSKPYKRRAGNILNTSVFTAHV